MVLFPDFFFLFLFFTWNIKIFWNINYRVLFQEFLRNYLIYCLYLFRCWSLKFKQSDHQFLHQSNVFHHINNILSKSDDGDSEESFSISIQSGFEAMSQVSHLPAVLCYPTNVQHCIEGETASWFICFLPHVLFVLLSWKISISVL